MPGVPLERLKAFLISMRFVFILYSLLAIVTAVKQFISGPASYNNYLIYKYTFWHSLQGQILYGGYPEEYFDSNHYGPVFALLMTPFAVLPDGIGMVLWNLANALLLVAGIYGLPLSTAKKSVIAFICAHEALGALLSFQFNVGLTGLMLLSFSYTIKQQETKAAVAIATGTLIKLYGIVGLAFFFFSKNKIRLIISGVIALAILFALPMVLHSAAFTVQSYADWYSSLVHKNAQNVSGNSMQDISLMGLVRRISGNHELPNTYFLLGGILLFALPYLRVKQYQYTAFRLMLLASTLIFVVIFSSGSESPTYIIAFTGVAIWFMIQPQPKSAWVIGLFVLALLLTSFSPSDLFPKFIRESYIKPYALKALPCVLVWLVIIYQMLRNDFKQYSLAAS
ncbi:glycosyltransferase family 87 protein [Pontibacter sp. SGAir0037]|uniref:glycosyltransferase family 87 protein n=1 Tax=Pontibacter sp. SGAir0037 TaxID=2571030 RepID=UPI0010CD30DB|nr:glycosyltransferase family 87 protein [Pontibacter sp. SGAir0037]QCR21548.1 hypothetical protein C1N53_03765 [Pontibacter sp. SGAir0037]